MPNTAGRDGSAAGASVAACGSSAPMSRRNPAAPSATIEPSATTCREPESAASIGTRTSQIAAKEVSPPVVNAAVVTSPVNAMADSTWALPSRPARA